MRTRLVVLAKAPVPGRVKTRLCPPCTPEQAAALARAALQDTLDAAAATDAADHFLALDGSAAGWLPEGWTVTPQRGAGLDERLAAAFADAAGPALLIGMDTPQVTPELLRRALAELERPGTDAVLGPASDGGYWAIGLRRPDPRVFLGVPMSLRHTAEAQLDRLGQLELRWRSLPTLRDVDDIADARAVAAACPGGRFARVLAEVSLHPLPAPA
jgi:hypothetical protein